MQTTWSECVADVYVGVKTHLCNVYTCPCTGPQNICAKCMQHSLQKNAHIYILTQICIRIHMHTNTHAHAWHRPHAEAPILRLTIYAQIWIHIHIHMCINAYIYIIIHTCTYIYIYTCPHTYTHTHIYTHTYKMYICTHASTPGMTARQQTREELMQTQGALHVSFVRRNQTKFSTSNAGTSLYPLPETQIPLKPLSLLSNIPQNSSRTSNKRNFTVSHWSNEETA